MRAKLLSLSVVFAAACQPGSTENSSLHNDEARMDELCRITNLDALSCTIQKEIARNVTSENIQKVALGYAKTAAMEYIGAVYPGIGLIFNMASKKPDQTPKFADLSEASFARIQDIVKKEVDRGLRESQIYDAKTVLNEAHNTLNFVITAKQNNLAVNLDSLLEASVRAVSPQIYQDSYVAAQTFQLAMSVRLVALREAGYIPNLRSEAAAAMSKLDRMHQDFVRSIQKSLEGETNRSAYNAQALQFYSRFADVFGADYDQTMETWAAIAGVPAPKEGKILAAGLARAKTYDALAATNSGLENFYVRHRNFEAMITTISSDLDRHDASFELVRGLAGTNCLSFRAVNVAGHYLRHRDYIVRLEKYDGSAQFANDATFCTKAPRDGSPFVNFVDYPASAAIHQARRSYEALNAPGYFLRHQNYGLFISNDSSPLGLQDQTFLVKRSEFTSP